MPRVKSGLALIPRHRASPALPSPDHFVTHPMGLARSTGGLPDRCQPMGSHYLLRHQSTAMAIAAVTKHPTSTAPVIKSGIMTGARMIAAMMANAIQNASHMVKPPPWLPR